MKTPSKIDKDFGSRPAIIRRSDGLEVNISRINEIKPNDRNYIESMFYLTIKDLSAKDFEDFVEYLLAHLLVLKNSRINADGILILKIQFIEELKRSAPNLSVKEIKTICYNGVRGFYNQESSDSNLSVSNFHKWKTAFLVERDISVKRTMELVNALPVEVVYDFSDTINQINKITLIKKDKEKHEELCFLFSQTLSSFIYSQLVKNELIRKDDYLNFIDESRSELKHKSENTSSTKSFAEMLEVIYSNEFDDFDSKTNNKAKQLSVYKFMMSLKKTIK